MNDRLDPIEDIAEWARTSLSIATILRARHVLALVEIAKAAREFIASAERFGPERYQHAKQELLAALSVLDDREAGEPRD